MESQESKKAFIVTTTLSDQAFKLLKDRILTGYYEPGHHLNEAQLSQELGTSRSPIREALQHLGSEGLVVFAPRKGAVVFELDTEKIQDLFEVRESLEVLAAGLAYSSAVECGQRRWCIRPGCKAEYWWYYLERPYREPKP